jgi:hypothetical protein
VRHTRSIVTRYGGLDELRVVEEECPELKDGEVRVQVLAAGFGGRVAAFIISRKDRRLSR